MTTLNPPAAAGKQKGPWFVGLSQQLDALLRFFDLRTRRTLGGWMDRKFKVARHTPAALVLPSILCGLLVLGSPDRYRWLFAAVVALVVGAVLVRFMQWSGRRTSSPIVADLVAQAAVIAIVGGLIWVSATNHQYRDGLPYRHALIPIAVAISVALLVGAALIGRLFKWPVSVSKYQCYLQDTELFLSAGPAAPLSTWTLLAGSAAVAFRAPLALLTVPAIATLVVPPVWIPFVPLVAGAVCVLAVLLAGLNDRFGTMWLLLQETLSKGGALLVSLVIVVLAVLRLADVSYATTIFDSAAWFDIAIVFVAAYVLSWWFDYWLYRVLTDQVMRLLSGGTSGVTAISYDIGADKARTSVPAEGRRLQVHGAGRIIAICENPKGGPPYFQAHQPMQLIELLATGGAPGGKAVPTPGQIYGRIAGYKAAAGLALGAILAWGVWQLHQGRQDPEVELKLTNEGVELTSLLTRQIPGDQPVIVLAASGGGTRAAVYTAAVLEGIARQGMASNVVLGSGVSGGGAALAYFAGRRSELIVAGSDAAWKQYFATITEPFIQDVLQRATEWRMVSSGRLGTLLSESFQRRWKLPESSRLSKVEDMGLILNTSLAGHFERPASAPAGPALKDIEPEYRERTTSTLAGGRLLLTNLKFPGSLAGKPLEPDATLALLPVTIRSPDLRLEEAAALNANFPPVFSNAAIDVDGKKRFWVTDGGAIDNRGMETLLYAVRLALKDMKKEQLPRLHIVVADASAFSSAYSQDRGLSSMTGGGARYASHLDAELVEAIRKTYEDAGVGVKFKFSYVMMPDLLRESGSFGTHWMLQERIRVHPAADPKADKAQKDEDPVDLSGKEMVEVIRALHTGVSGELKPDACKVLHWSRKDAGHSKGWSEVLAALGGTDAAPTCKLK